MLLLLVTIICKDVAKDGLLTLRGQIEEWFPPSLLSWVGNNHKLLVTTLAIKDFSVRIWAFFSIYKKILVLVSLEFPKVYSHIIQTLDTYFFNDFFALKFGRKIYYRNFEFSRPK